MGRSDFDKHVDNVAFSEIYHVLKTSKNIKTTSTPDTKTEKQNCKQPWQVPEEHLEQTTACCMWEPQPPWDLLGPPASWQFQVFLIVFRRGSWSQGSFEGLGLQLMGVLLKVKWGEICASSNPY